MIPTKNVAPGPDISCHDFIILKLLHFLIYENDIAIFGSAKALTAIDNITG